MERSEMIDRIEGLTGVYTDWSSLPTEGLKRLLDHLEYAQEVIERQQDTIEHFQEIQD